MKILIIGLILLLILTAYLIYNKFFKESSIFEEIKIPEPLYQP